MEKKEFERLLEEAKNGNAHSMYLVGIEYELGQIVKFDMQEALAWISDAADLGDDDAKAWIEDYYFDDDANTQAHS